MSGPPRGVPDGLWIEMQAEMVACVETERDRLKALLLDVVNALPDDYDAVWNALGYPVENYYPSDCPPLEVYRRRAAGLFMRLREVAGELPKLSVPNEELCAGCDEVLDDPEEGVQFQVGSQVFHAHDNEDCPEDAEDRLKGFNSKEAP